MWWRHNLISQTIRNDATKRCIQLSLNKHRVFSVQKHIIILICKLRSPRRSVDIECLNPATLSQLISLISRLIVFITQPSIDVITSFSLLTVSGLQSFFRVRVYRRLVSRQSYSSSWNLSRADSHNVCATLYAVCCCLSPLARSILSVVLNISFIFHILVMKRMRLSFLNFASPSTSRVRSLASKQCVPSLSCFFMTRSCFIQGALL